MNILLRILLTIYAFCLTFISFFAMAVTFNPGFLDKAYNYIRNNVLESRIPSVLMFLIGLVFFALSLTFLFSGYRRNKDKRGVSKHTNIGEIKISLNTIENIALNASRKLIGVKDTKAYVDRLNDGVSILIKAVVLPDINIPMLSEDIQVKVKSAVEDSAGIKVLYVKVLIENIYTGYKSRVE